MTEEIIVLENDKLDQIEKNYLNAPQVECPVEHYFLPGFYIRVFRAPADTFIISKKHKTRHQYSVSEGEASVWDENNGVKLIKAGDSGITEPNTRRALYTHSPITWTTTHAHLSQDVDEIEQDIIDNSDNPLLSEDEQQILNAIKRFHAHSPNKELTV